MTSHATSRGVSAAAPYRELLALARPDRSGIFLSAAPAPDWRVDEHAWFTEVIGPRLGSEVATYLNTPHKAAYRALSEQIQYRSILPEYFYSCKPLDDMLLGCYPKTLYFDVGRGGVWNTVARSAGYLDVALRRLWEKRHQDKVLREFIAQHGLGGCIPLLTRRTLISWALQEQARLYAVPSTSIAEAVILTSKVFPKMRAGVKKIMGKSPWLDRDLSVRDRGSRRLFEALKSYLFEKHGAQAGLSLFAAMTLGEKGTLGTVCRLYMEMVEDFFPLTTFASGAQQPADAVYFELARRLHDPRAPHSHPSFGGQADSSEIVVCGRQPLSAAPWEAVLLFGDRYGTSTEQLLTMAHAWRAVYPDAVIVILTHTDGTPLILERDGELLARMSITWMDGLLGDRVEREFAEDMLVFTGDIPALRDWKKRIRARQTQQ